MNDAKRARMREKSATLRRNGTNTGGCLPSFLFGVLWIALMANAATHILAAILPFVIDDWGNWLYALEYVPITVLVTVPTLLAALVVLTLLAPRVPEVPRRKLDKVLGVYLALVALPSAISLLVLMYYVLLNGADGRTIAYGSMVLYIARGLATALLGAGLLLDWRRLTGIAGAYVLLAFIATAYHAVSTGLASALITAILFNALPLAFASLVGLYTILWRNREAIPSDPFASEALDLE